MKNIISNITQLLSPMLWGEIDSISNLKKYQKMEILYQSRGCFHNKSHIFLFNDNFVTIYSSILVYQKKQKIGELLLSKKDIIGLDKQLRIYSKNMMMGCTTTDSVAIKVMIGSLVIQKYNFSDNSCNMHGQKDVLTFNSLLERLSKTKETS